MAEKASSSSSAGIGFTGLLTVAFVVLKLTRFIAWSWWWVLSPLWIAPVLWLLVLAAIFGGAWLYATWDEKRTRRLRAERETGRKFN